MDWIALAQDRGMCASLVNTVVNFRVQQKVGEFFE
jgi:hypothetical protein